MIIQCIILRYLCIETKCLKTSVVATWQELYLPPLRSCITPNYKGSKDRPRLYRSRDKSLFSFCFLFMDNLSSSNYYILCNEMLIRRLCQLKNTYYFQRYIIVLSQHIPTIKYNKMLSTALLNYLANTVDDKIFTYHTFFCIICNCTST